MKALEMRRLVEFTIVGCTESSDGSKMKEEGEAKLITKEGAVLGRVSVRASERVSE